MHQFSQFGAEKILEPFIPNIENNTCMEFGAKDGIHNSNTAHLIYNYNFKGIMLEKNERYKWAIEFNYKNYPVNIIINSINKDNINQYVPDNLGILSIDVDGCDYYLWKDLTINPEIVIIEYNPNKKGDFLMPYDIEKNNFKYNRKEYGASKDVIICLAEEKKYSLIGDDTNNLYFKRYL